MRLLTLFLIICTYTTIATIKKYRKNPKSLTASKILHSPISMLALTTMFTLVGCGYFYIAIYENNLFGLLDEKPRWIQLIVSLFFYSIMLLLGGFYSKLLEAALYRKYVFKLNNKNE